MRWSWLVASLLVVGLLVGAVRYLLPDEPGGATYSLQPTKACLQNAGFRVSLFLERSKGGAYGGPLDWIYADRQPNDGYVDLGFAVSPRSAHAANEGDSEPAGRRQGNVILDGLGADDRKVLDCLRTDTTAERR
jgi:hypothetical protein